MPKTITARHIIKLLEHNGFVLDRIKGSHHIFLNPATKKLVIVPLHKKDLPKGTLHDILKGAGLSLDDL